MKRKSSSAVGTPVPAKVPKATPKTKTTRTVASKAQTKRVAVKKNPVKNGPQKKQTTAKKVTPKRKPPVAKASATKAKRAAPAKKTAAKKKPAAKKKAGPKKKATPAKKATQKKKTPPKKKVAKKATASKKGQTGKGKAKAASKKVAVKKDGQKKPKVHPNDKLTPNPAIDVAKKDIFFEEKNTQGSLELSSIGKAKTAIQAVITKDMALLKKLINSPKEVPSLFIPRSVDLPEDALCAAMRANNKDAMALLIGEMTGRHKPGNTARMSLGIPTLQKENTGRYNYRTLGHAVRAINVARGGREGNDAFAKDISSYHVRTNYDNYARFAANNIDTMAVLQPFLNHPDFGENFKDQLLSRIWEFARRGAYKVTGQLAKMAHENDAYGFNRLHYEVLTCSKPEELTPFRSVSVRKKPYDNQKITPLHLAAINPNPNMMLSLLAVVPEFYIQDKNGYGLIHYAAACEGSGPLEALVSRGVFPNQATTMGLTPLMIASSLGRIQNMIYLLKPRKLIPLPGAMQEVRFVDTTKGSMTPLHFAAESGQAEACKLLVDHGANIEAMMSAAHNKLTPIMLASRCGHFKVVKILVEAKASLDAKDKLKRTPLSLAVMNGNYVVASYLLRKGADPNSRDTSGNTPLHYAAGYGWWHCVKLLLKAGADPNTMNDWKVPPLCIAFLKGHSDCADVLIREAGVGVDFRDAEGWTMVMMTVSSPVNDETVKQLKFLVEKKKADVTLQDGDGWNAMHHLASSPVQSYRSDQESMFAIVIECAQILMKHGCDISAKADSGETPLNIVMQQAPINTKLVQLLMNKGATMSLDAGVDGENVLHLLAKKVVNGDQSELFDLLWKQNATDGGNKLMDLMNVQDQKGFTPLLRLFEVYQSHTTNRSPGVQFCKNVTSLFKRFISKGKADIDYAISEENKLADPHDKARGAILFYLVHPFHGVVPSDSTGLSQRLGMLKEFLAAKPKINVRDQSGKTPLLQAIEYGEMGEKAAEMLVSAGADVNMPSKVPETEDDLEKEEEEKSEPMSPVIQAAKQSLFSLVEVLLARQASPSSPGNESNLLHHLAASTASPVKVIKCLEISLKRQRDINVRDAKKRTPLHYAVKALTAHSTTDVVEFLLQRGADAFAKDADDRLPLHYAFLKSKDSKDSSQLDPIEVVTMLTASTKGFGVESRDVQGCTPLHYAAFRGATISFIHLVEHFSNLDAADNLGNTVLSFAVSGKHDSIAVPLIQRGANINVSVSAINPDYKQWEEKQEKLKKGKSVWQLEEHKPPVPERILSKSLLYYVVDLGWQGVLYLLMDRLERFGLPKTAIIQAILEAKKWQLGLSLVQKKMKNLQGKDLLNDKKQNMLHVLALNSKKTGPLDSNLEHLQVATALLSLGNKPSQLDSYGCSAFTYAILARDFQLCSLFFEHDKKNAAKCLSTSDSQGRNAFSAFFYHEIPDEDMWRLLSKHGMSPNQVYLMPDWSAIWGKPPSLTDPYHSWKPLMVSQTPLMAAIKNRTHSWVKFLVKNGADVNKEATDLITPLMVAVKTNDSSIVRLLFDPDFEMTKLTNARVAQNRSIGFFGTSMFNIPKPAVARRNNDSDASDASDMSDMDEEDEMDVDDDETTEGEKPSKDAELKNVSKVNLSRLDRDKRNVFHYLLLGNKNGTYENTAILNLLAQHAPVALLTSPDKNGQTPLDLAISARAEKLTKAMAKIIKKNVKCSDRVPLPASDGVRWKKPFGYDFKADAEAMLAEINALATAQSEATKQKAKVDHRIGQTKGVEVVEDKDQGIPYSLLMTKVDVKYGTYGMNNFYKMQIVYQKGKDMYLLFTCWGRIGDEGQNQRTPFATAEEAIKEFCKIFAAKSGNQWSNVKNFTHHPGKYKLMEVEPHASRKALKAFNFDLNSNLASELPQAIQDLLKQLTSVPILDAVLKHSRVSPTLMPFGQLKREVILEAKEILVKVRKLNEEIKNDVDSNKLTDQSAAKMDEILDLSSKYYQLIPYVDFAFDKMSPLNTMEDLKEAENNIQNLVDLELANRVLLGAQYNIKEMNPLDYIYRALGCKIQILDEKSTEAQLILQQIEQTKGHNDLKVDAIYRLARENEEKELYDLQLDNHQLLWHGTKTSNLISIMKRGLLTQPIESHGITGKLYGQGIYTANVVDKSINYCHNFYDRATTKFMLLCEVAVGKAQTNVEEEGFQAGFNSLFSKGQTCPDEDYNLRLAHGASIPMGKLTRRQSSNTWFSYDEVVVYTEEQICLRYLVQFRD